MLALWISEFLLESLGCWYARRRMKPLCLYLGLRAFGDVASAVSLAFGPIAYWWADLIQRTIQYPLFWILAVYLVGRILHEQRRIIRLYSFMAGSLCVSAVIFFYAQGITWALINKFEMYAQGAAAAMVATAFGMVELDERPEPGRIVRLCGYGVIVKAGWDVIISGGLSHGWDVSWLYPYGAIVALSIWTFACAKKDSCSTVEGREATSPSRTQCARVANGAAESTLSSEYQASPAGMFSGDDAAFLRGLRIIG